ncbi:MAG TPA: glycoside hydrolase family 36 protein [Vicinamibacteria bacterium]|nr:glycoside hydrolase family 36 protein [Vicinamibacteria bacterium]
MTKHALPSIAVVLVVIAGPARAAEPVSLSQDGWTIRAHPDQGLLSVAHDRLGTLVRNARLNLSAGDGLRTWAAFAAEPAGRALRLRTVSPRTTWVFATAGDRLTVSSTSPGAVLTGEVLAPADRPVARLLDPAGTPVDWVGTDEVAHGYGGSETRNPSFLPARNPDVMYFALGPVSATTLHALFDRRTDTAVGFPEAARLQRSHRDREALDLTLPVPGSAVIHVFPDYFQKTLGVPFYVPFDDATFPRPPIIWCSWTSYYAEVREEDVVRNADWIAANLEPYGFDYVQLDDGYDRGTSGAHYWIERWDQAKFPHGPRWLAGYVKSKGLRPGLWLVPNAYAGAVEQHPDWYLRDTQGRIIKDYDTPALDSTHPEVLGFLRTLFTTLRNWGFEYYKFDGEHALPRYVPAVDRSRLHDPSLDPLVAYRRRLEVIRETIGPGTFVEGCPAGTPLNGIGFFNSYFDGHDVYNSWQGMYALFSSINANAFWNHVVAYVMPGEGIEIGPPMSREEAQKRRPRSFLETALTREEPFRGFGTTLAEARTLVSLLSLTGVAYPVSSVMPELPAERVTLLRKTLPTLPILPVDLFSRGTDMQWDRFKHTTPDDYVHHYPEILDLKVSGPSGTYDAVGVTNWRSESATRTVSLTDKLGLAPGRYLAFDSWAETLLGVFSESLALEVAPHDTRVVLVHPLLPRPQLVGNSRHLTGAHSITALEWDDARRVLRGTSSPVAGERYTLFVHVPEGFTATGARAHDAAGHEVPVTQARKSPLLEVSFPGGPEPLAWEVAFSTAAPRSAAGSPPPSRRASS